MLLYLQAVLDQFTVRGFASMASAESAGEQVHAEPLVGRQYPRELVVEFPSYVDQGGGFFLRESAVRKFINGALTLKVVFCMVVIWRGPQIALQWIVHQCHHGAPAPISDNGLLLVVMLSPQISFAVGFAHSTFSESQENVSLIDNIGLVALFSM
jgi:hypothetical protein